MSALIAYDKLAAGSGNAESESIREKIAAARARARNRALKKQACAERPNALIRANGHAQARGASRRKQGKTLE